MTFPTRLLGAAALVTGLGLFSPLSAAEPARADADMQSVLDALAALKAKPFSTIEVQEARTQASPADAARTVQRDMKIPPGQAAQVRTKDIAIPSATGNLPARVYTPPGKGPFPIIVYFHGGGWVVADLNVYDATPRSLALGAKAIVLSVDYRHAPEHKFPAAHDDAWTAYAWAVENGHDIGGDTKRIAVAGESAGANLAANVALKAKALKAQAPVHQLLVYPVAGASTETPSYVENAAAKPLGKADMEWFIARAFTSKDEAKDERIDLVDRTDLKGVAPATIVLAQIDPLRSEGEAYAQKLEQAGVDVDVRTFDGVTHEFFGMGAVVAKAKEANDFANARLASALAKTN